MPKGKGIGFSRPSKAKVHPAPPTRPPARYPASPVEVDSLLSRLPLDVTKHISDFAEDSMEYENRQRSRADVDKYKKAFGDKTPKRGKGKASPLEKALAKRNKRLDELTSYHAGLSKALGEMKANFHPRYSDPTEIRRHERTLRQIEGEAHDMEYGEVKHPIVKELGHLYHHGSVPKDTSPIIRLRPKSKLSMMSKEHAEPKASSPIPSFLAPPFAITGGGYKLRKAPKRDAYWVIGLDGRHHSKEPLSLEMAKKQMIALNIASSKKGDGVQVASASAPPPPPPPSKKNLLDKGYDNPYEEEIKKWTSYIKFLRNNIRRMEQDRDDTIDFMGIEGWQGSEREAELERAMAELQQVEERLSQARLGFQQHCQGRRCKLQSKRGGGLYTDRLNGESKMLIKDMMKKYDISSYDESVIQGFKDEAKRQFKAIGSTSTLASSDDKERVLKKALSKIEEYMKSLIPKLDVKHRPAKYSEVHDIMPHLSLRQSEKKKQGLLQPRTGSGKFKDKLDKEVGDLLKKFKTDIKLPYDKSRVADIVVKGYDELSKFGKSYGSPTLEAEKDKLISKTLKEVKSYLISLIPRPPSEEIVEERTSFPPTQSRRGGLMKSDIKVEEDPMRLAQQLKLFYDDYNDTKQDLDALIKEYDRTEDFIKTMSDALDVLGVASPPNMRGDIEDKKDEQINRAMGIRGMKDYLQTLSFDIERIQDVIKTETEKDPTFNVDITTPTVAQAMQSVFPESPSGSGRKRKLRK